MNYERKHSAFSWLDIRFSTPSSVRICAEGREQEKKFSENEHEVTIFQIGRVKFRPDGARRPTVGEEVGSDAIDKI